MRRLFGTLVALAIAVVPLGCSQATTAPTNPTAVPQTKAVFPATPTPQTPPAQASAAQAPTAAPASKVSYPAGKPVTLIVPWGPGGTNDVGARLLAAPLEKELGTTIQVVNKAGASSQVGITDMTQAKPDGYTLGYLSAPAGITPYLDPDRKSAYARKDIQFVAMVGVDTQLVAVKADSPYKTLKDLIDAAKSNPEKIRFGGGGIQSASHLMIAAIEQASGAKFAVVNLNGDPEAISGVLGGHLDAMGGGVAGLIPQVKSGAMRVLGTTSTDESPFFPGVEPLMAQGVDVYLPVSRGIGAPAGTPKEITATISAAVKRVLASEEYKKKCAEAALAVDYLDSAEYEANWVKVEGLVKPLIDQMKAQPAKKQ